MTDDGVTRRDFLNGARIAIGASLVTPWAELLAAGIAPPSDYYPPALTGMRGTHDGAWEVMHGRVSGKTWPEGKPEEEYDLVIVGGDTRKFYKAFDQKLYPSLGLSKAIVFDQENFGERRLVTGYGKIPWEEFAARARSARSGYANTPDLLWEPRTRG